MSTIVFRNSQEAFIHKNVFRILQAEGHEPLNASRAADLAVETYRTTAAFGGRGGQMLRLLSWPRSFTLAASQEKGRKSQAFTG